MCDFARLWEIGSTSKCNTVSYAASVGAVTPEFSGGDAFVESDDLADAVFGME